MSAKSKGHQWPSKNKQKNLNYCVPCGNSYESEKKLYDHCCGLLHQVRRKENEKDFKPCCFLCKNTFPTLDAYGDHLRKDAHKENHKKFKQAIEEGKTIQQLVKAKAILSPIPCKPLREGVSTPKKSVKHASQVQPSANKNHTPDTNFFQNPNPNYGWNFDQSQPPLNYGEANFHSYPLQRFPGGQYSFYRHPPNAYNWISPEGNANFTRFHSNDNRRFRQPSYQQNVHARQYHNPSWSFPVWQNNQYYTKQRNDYFNDQPNVSIRPNQDSSWNAEDTRINSNNSKPIKRQHIYYVDKGKATDNSKIATEDTKQAAGVEKKATEGKEGTAISRKSNSPKSFENQKSSSPRDIVPISWEAGQSTSENDRPARRKLTPQDFTFALPESQTVDNSISDNCASPLRLTKSPFDIDKRTPQTPTMTNTILNDSCWQQSPKGIGSPRVQQQLNAENLRNLVNLSCSRKDKFLLDKLMYEYDQMTIKAAMNRMGQNLVTLVDKDAAKDVIASLSAIGLIEPGGTNDDRPSSRISEKLMGQIEELIQRSYHNDHPTDGYSKTAPFQNCHANQNAEFSTNMEADSEFEKSQSGPGLSHENCSLASNHNQQNSDSNVAFLQYPDSSTTVIQSSPKKKKKPDKKKSSKGALSSESEVKDHCKTIAQDYEVVSNTMTPLTPLKKKKNKPNSSNEYELSLDIDAHGHSPGDDMTSLLSSLNNETVSSEIDSQKKPPKAGTSKKKTKSDKNSSKSCLKNSSKDVKAKKSNMSKLKSKVVSDVVKMKKAKKKSAKSPKKKKASLEQPPELDSSSLPEPTKLEETMADTGLGLVNTPAEAMLACNSPHIDATAIEHEAEDHSMNDNLPEVIEEPFIKLENDQENVIDLEAPETLVSPQRIPVAGILEKAAPTQNLEGDNSSYVTVRALNFAIEEENIQCEILHIERKLGEMRDAFESQQEEMRAAFDRQLADMKAGFERDFEEATLSQEKLKERRTFVRQQCDSLMKSLLKSQDGRAIASSLKRIFSEIPNDLKMPEGENPLQDVNVQDSVTLRDLPQSMPVQTGNETPDIAYEELSNTSESTNHHTAKRKRLDKCENNSKRSPTKKVKTITKKGETATNVEKKGIAANVEKKGMAADVEKEKMAAAIEKKEPIKIIKKEIMDIKLEEAASRLAQMLPNCEHVETAKLKKVLHFSGHVDAVVVLKMHKSRLYSCSNDGTIRQFKTKGKDNSSEMKCIATFTHQAGNIVAMEIIHQKDNEPFIVTASKYGTLKKFDTITGNCLITLETKNEVVHLTPRWGSLFVSFFDGNISRHSLSHFKELDSYPCSSLPITCVASATEGAYRILCIGSGDGLITLKEAHSGLFIRSFALEEEYPFKIQVLNEDSYTLGCHNQQCRTIYVHKLLNGDLLQRINIVASVVCMQVISPNLIMLGGKFGVIRLCDPEKKTKQLYYGAGSKIISSLCLHHNLVISGSEDGKIEACELALNQTFVCNYGKCPGTFAYHEDIIYHVKKIHAGSSQSQCLGNNCDYIFQKDQSDRIRHILTHVQLNQDK